MRVIQTMDRGTYHPAPVSRKDAKTPRRQEDRRAFGHVGYVQRSPYNRSATNDPPSTIHSMRMVQPKDRGTYQPFLPHAKTPVSELIRTTRDLVVWGTRLNVVILDAIRLCNQVLAVDANTPFWTHCCIDLSSM
jgi:hypothetical protein